MPKLASRGPQTRNCKTLYTSAHKFSRMVSLWHSNWVIDTMNVNSLSDSKSIIQSIILLQKYSLDSLTHNFYYATYLTHLGALGETTGTFINICTLPVCCALWVSLVCLRANVCPQISQVNGLFVACVARCVCRALLSPKPLWHTSVKKFTEN